MKAWTSNILGPACWAGAALALAAGAPVTASDARTAAGERVAARTCGVCHAVGQGASPLADAPPFRELHRRYPPGGLDQLLEEGMLPSDHPQEEGSPSRHPRMPVVPLEPDEVASLKAYLKSLEPP